MRTLITGWPRTGKTTLAKSLGPHTSTDDFIGMGWDAAIEHISRLLERPGSWVIEGVQVARALRYYHERYPSRPVPCDRLYVLRKPRMLLSAGQRTMGKGIDTVLGQIAGWLNGTTILGAARAA